MTLAEALQFLKDRDRAASSTERARIHLQMVNDARMELARAGLADQDRRVKRLSFAAPYTTGTVAIAPGETTLVGTDTVWTEGMVGRLVRINQEPLLYAISAVDEEGQEATIETYMGGDTHTASTYEILDCRQALASNFRQLAKPVLSLPDQRRLEPLSADELRRLLMRYLSSDRPDCYAVEEIEDEDGLPHPYLWVCPAPNEALVLEVPMYLWPAKIEEGGEDIPLAYELEGAFRDFLLAALRREQGADDWAQDQQKALASARGVLQARRQGVSREREAWDPDGGQGGWTQPLIASGEPKYV
jgi:hypothetical protein